MYQSTVSYLVAGVGFEPHDLRVMSPTSYQAALPRDILFSRASWCRKPGSNRYDTHVSRDFKSRASANSAIPAKPIISTALRPAHLSSYHYYNTKKSICQPPLLYFLIHKNYYAENPNFIQKNYRQISIFKITAIVQLRIIYRASIT